MHNFVACDNQQRIFITFLFHLWLFNSFLYSTIYCRRYALCFIRIFWHWTYLICLNALYWTAAFFFASIKLCYLRTAAFAGELYKTHIHTTHKRTQKPCRIIWFAIAVNKVKVLDYFTSHQFAIRAIFLFLFFFVFFQFVANSCFLWLIHAFLIV